jgi:flagellar assembly protein FliH
MSSKLYRGGEVPVEPPAWRRVAPRDPLPPVSDAYVAASYPAIGGSAPMGRAPEQAAGALGPRAAYQQGFQAGQDASRQELAAQAEAMNARAARSIEELSGLRQRFRHEAEEEVVALAIAVARRILHRELTVEPEALLGLVKAALEKIEAREVHSARVSRLDAPMVERYLEKMGLPRRVEVIADPGLERGALLLESPRGALDASVETQLSEIERGFADLVRRT